MTFIDTDIFVIDKLFPKDDRYEVNKAFLKEAKDRLTSIFNLFELLGIASFNLNEVELMKLFVTWNTKHFVDRTYMSVQTPKEFLELR